MRIWRSAILTLTILTALGAGYFVWAEQSSGSPESSAASRLKSTYDSVAALSHGSESAGSWGNWGAWWNRLRSAAEWVPDGTATAGQAAKGVTFYAGSRTPITGTATNLISYQAQSLQSKDDYAGTKSGEESSWTNTATNVWKDDRTNLYWSSSQGNQTNSFTLESCDFFTTTPRGSYAGADSDCGNAINACATLSLDANGGDAETDWYLPSQGELMQAYLNGIYNQTGSAFASTSAFWSSSERSDNSSYAWNVTLLNGFTYYYDKPNSGAVRCVRRD